MNSGLLIYIVKEYSDIKRLEFGPESLFCLTIAIVLAFEKWF